MDGSLLELVARKVTARLILALAPGPILLLGMAACRQATLPGETRDPRLAVRRTVSGLQQAASLDLEHPDWKSELPPPPELTFDERRDYFWSVTTSQGRFTVRLFPDAAPRHVANILYLSEVGYYDGLYFHRVVPGLIVQGGALRPDRRGGPGPGYSLDEPPCEALDYGRRGRVAMVRHEGRSLGGQFFVTLEPAPWLDGQHAIFGEVVEGLQTVRQLGQSLEEGVGEPPRMLRARVLVAPTTTERVARHMAYLEEVGLLDRTRSDWRSLLLPDPPQIRPTAGKSYTWHLETGEGPIEVRLFAEQAPRHVVNILYLAELGYYDGLYFHRVRPGFVAQGGGVEPERGGAAPGYSFEQERRLRHDRPYRVAMVASDARLSHGGQFFITYAATPWLDAQDTVFGQVVAGLDTLSRIEALGSPTGASERPIRIVRTWTSESNAEGPLQSEQAQRESP